MEIRAPREEEFHDIVELGNITFGEEAAPEDEAAYRRDFPFDRALCAYDAGRMVGSLAVFSMELTLPGRKAIPAGGATWGATLPTHRRRGILRSLFRAQMRDMMEREEPVTILGASEATIYQRFGYGAASTIMSFSVERAYADLAPQGAGATASGITLVAGVEAAGRLAGVFEALRLDQPGAVSRSPTWWSGYLADPPLARQGATRMYHAVHTGPTGIDDGYVSYRIKDQWLASTPMNEVMVVELLAGNRDAYRALWRYVIGTDLCQTISYGRARVDEPLRWLLADSRRLVVNAVSDDLYLRLLDIPRALMARTYSAPGEVVFEVIEIIPRSTHGALPADGRGTSRGRRDRGRERRLSSHRQASRHLSGRDHFGRRISWRRQLHGSCDGRSTRLRGPSRAREGRRHVLQRHRPLLFNAVLGCTSTLPSPPTGRSASWILGAWRRNSANGTSSDSWRSPATRT